MGKKSRCSWWYASVGGHSGEALITQSWALMEKEVSGINAKHKKFATKEEAKKFTRKAEQSPVTSAKPVRLQSPGPCYAVIGPYCGVYSDWAEAGPRSQGIPGGTSRRCKSVEEGNRWIKTSSRDTTPHATPTRCLSPARSTPSSRSSHSSYESAEPHSDESHGRCMPRPGTSTKLSPFDWDKSTPSHATA